MDAIVVVAGIVGLIWMGVLLWRGGLLGGCLAVLLAATCFGVPFFKVYCGPLPITLDRVLLILVCLQYVFWRRWGWADPKPVSKPEVLLAVFVGFMVFSTFSADWTRLSYQPLSWLILYYLMPAIVYWIVRQTKFTERSVLGVFGYFALLGVYLAGTAIAEYYEAWTFVFPKYIVTTAADPLAEFVGRGRGPLLNPIGNGMLLTVGLSVLLFLWQRMEVGRPAEKTGGGSQASCDVLLWLQHKWLARMGLAAAIFLVMGAIGLSLTRSVWMSGIFCLALIVVPMIPRHWRFPLVGGSLIVGLLIVGTQWEHLVSFKRDKRLSAEETADSVELRPIMAVVAWQMFLDHPWFGCGYAQYVPEHLNYLSDRSTDLPLERARTYGLHNVAFSLLTENGLAGFGLFLAIQFFWIRDAWRLWRSTRVPLWVRQQGLLFLIFAGIYWLNGMFHDVSIIPMMNMILFFLAGVTAALRPFTVEHSQGQPSAIAG